MIPKKIIFEGREYILEESVTVNSLSDFVKAYLMTILFAETDDSNPEQGGEPLDENYDINDFSEEALTKAQEDCDKFRELAGKYFKDYDEEKIAQDFWFTRNGHGVGFWDTANYEKEDGLALTDISKKYFGEMWVTIGDDGKIYLSK